MLDNMAMGIGALVLWAGGLYVFYLIANAAFVSLPAMCRAWGLKGMLMMGFWFAGWGWLLYALAHSDQYSTFEVVLPTLVTSTIYIGWLASVKPKTTL